MRHLDDWLDDSREGSNMAREQHDLKLVRFAPAASLILLGASLLSPTLATSVRSQPVQDQQTKPLPLTKNELILTAAEVVRASKQLSQVWPGYWPEDQAFIINVGGMGALLISPGPKPASFKPISSSELPPEIKGKAFFHEGVLSGAQRPFVTDFPIGEGKSAMLVNAQDRDAAKTMALMLHEQFHAYQRTAFKGREKQFVDPLAVKDRVAFATTADMERNILVEALNAKAAGERQKLLQQYFAVRRERERTVSPDVVKVEQDFERSEGTASYAEKASLVAVSGDELGLKRLLVKQLNEKLDAKGAYASTWFRGRSYSTGAALTYLISQHDAGAWRAKIESGAKLDALLESLVGVVPARRAAGLAKAARTRFGYEARRRELEPIIRVAEKAELKSVAEFLALDAYQVVFDPGAAGAGAKSGFSARNMTNLGPTTTALPRAMVFNVAGSSFSLTVRDRPVLLELRRVTVLLPGPPQTGGPGTLSPGEHHLEKLRVFATGYELKVDTPVTVQVEPHRMVVRLGSGNPS